MPSPVFTSDIFEQKRTLEDLIEESKADGGFYLFLTVSAVITTLGLLIDNAVVVIGGMLVAPLLQPLLFLSMAVTTSSVEGIMRATRTLVKSILIVLGISTITAFMFGGGEVNAEILSRTEPNLILFFVAFFAGIAGAFSWARHKLSATLAGIAISVSLIPPLCTVGIGFALVSRSIITGSFTLFVINLLGIVFAGIIIFLLFGFAKLQKEEEEIIHEEKIEVQIQKQAVEEQKELEDEKHKELGIK